MLVVSGLINQTLPVWGMIGSPPAPIPVLRDLDVNLSLIIGLKQEHSEIISHVITTMENINQTITSIEKITHTFTSMEKIRQKIEVF